MATQEKQPLLLAADEVAAMLNVSERTLWRLLSAGKVPSPVRIGRNTRWRLGELTEWIERGCPGGSDVNGGMMNV